MTNNNRPANRGTTLTGIDIRKALIADGKRPSAYDEQRLWEHCDHWGINTPEGALKAADDFKKGW